jgi:class 3 adenylate cyclase
MRCSKCGTESLPGKRFCAECGSPISIRCPKCGADTAAIAKFCADCGAALADVTGASADSPNASSTAKEIRVSRGRGDTADAIEGERKTVTALFADIKGSMELMEGIDPEEARAIIDPALKLMIDAVDRYGGYVVQSTGDGIFALFGAPVAHEDHPQRALYSALRMHEAMRQYGERLRAERGLNLQLRIGVNIGEVVVRNIQTGTEHTEYSPIGHSTSLAARLQTLATPGSTVISGNMRALVEGYFQLKGLGPTRIKGVSEPVEMFEVTGLGPLRTRLQWAAGRGLTKFVGRQREMDVLNHAAEQAQAGHGQIVAVIAEPGVGKSRLFYEFKATSQSGWMVLEAFSVSHGKAWAYLPVLELLSEYFEISRDDDDRKRGERILAKVLRLDRNLEDTLPYLYFLQGIADAGDSLAQMDPHVRRRRTLDAIKRILLRESINQPLMIIFEDLHWIDSETQAVLDPLVEVIASARLLLLVNYRPEYRHDWGSRTHYTQLRLDPLGAESAEEMLATLLGHAKDLTPLKQLIIERTQGTPFFMEEMVQAMFEEGVLQQNGIVKLARPVSAVKVPATVQAVLASRIDRLAAGEKELLQTLAVLGREFPLTLVKRVATKSDDELERILTQLQLGEFIHEQPAIADFQYSFKHALTQEVAYNSLLNERRKKLHGRTGAAIESLYAEHLEEQIEELAYHYRRSDNRHKALQYLRAAAEEAFKRSHHNQAITHAKAALTILGTLPVSPDTLRTELGLQFLLAQALGAALGYGAAEAGQAFDRALSLARRIEDATTEAAILGGLWVYQSARADHPKGYELALELQGLSTDQGGEAFVVDACYAVGTNLFWMGEFAESARILQKGVEEYRPGQRLLNIATSDTLCWVLGYLAACLWHLGYPGKAMDVRIRTLQRAESVRDRYTTAAARLQLSIMRVNRRDPNAEEDVRETIAISSADGFTSMRLWGEAFAACARLQAGSLQEMRVLLDSMDGLQNMGAHLGFPWLSTIAAAAYARAGNPTDALDIIDKSLADIEQTSEREAEAELYRIKGEALLIQNAGAFEDAQSCFCKAIEIARRQSAKSWELRATASLSRLLANHARRDEARTMLSQIYGWFTEGFDTADLRDAKALLDELGD